MAEENPTEEIKSEKEGVSLGKVHKHRSPNYPIISLEKALGRAQTLSEHARQHQIAVPVARSLWGYKRGAGDQIVSALKSFGLVEVQGEKDDRQLRLSDSAWRILGDAPDRSELLKSAALKPDIYKEIWEKYEGDLPGDALIKRYLQWERHFNPKFVDNFIDQFKETLTFAGINLSDNVSSESQEREAQQEEMASINALHSGDSRSQSSLAPSLGQRDFPLYLTNQQKGSLYVPAEMSAKDYKLLKTQLDNYLSIILVTSVADESSEKEPDGEGDGDSEDPPSSRRDMT